MTYAEFKNLLHSSKEYKMDCNGHLTITNYRTGASITLDLAALSEEAFGEITAEETEEDAEW